MFTGAARYLGADDGGGGGGRRGRGTCSRRLGLSVGLEEASLQDQRPCRLRVRLLHLLLAAHSRFSLFRTSCSAHGTMNSTNALDIVIVSEVPLMGNGVMQPH